MLKVGDALELEGRPEDVVPDKQRGATKLEPAITMSVAEIHAAHGERPLTTEEFKDYFGDLSSDGEG